MATRPVFLFIGNSNMDGYATFDDVDADDFARWTGSGLPSTYPKDVTVPGVRMWTPKVPCSAATTYTSTAKTSTSIDLDGYSFAGTDEGRWIYVRSATAGQGQHRRILGTSSGDTIDVSAWTTEPTVGASVELLTSSHSCDTGATTTSIPKKSTTANLASTPGKWITFISGVNAGTTKRILSNTTTTVTLEDALLVAPSEFDGFVICDETGTVDGLSTYTSSNGSLRDMRLYHDKAYWSKTGYDYPNFTSVPWGGPFTHWALQRFNCVPELTWQLRQSFLTSIVGIHLGVGSSTMSPNYTGTYYAGIAASWAHDITAIDWQPSTTNGLWSVLIKQLTAVKAAIVAEGDTMSVDGVFVVLGEVDASTDERASKAAENMALIRQTLRAYLADNGMSSKRAGEIPWVMSNVGSTAWAADEVVNAAFQQMVDDDPWTAMVDTSDFTYESDTIHFDADGATSLGAAFFEAWKELRSRYTQALRVDAERPSLAAVRTKVRKRYERNSSGSDDTNSQITLFLNDAMREIILTLGDNAWFMRRSARLTMDSSFPGTVTLPREVERLLRVESEAVPGMTVPWKGLTYTDNGRMQITLHTTIGGPYIGHWMLPYSDVEMDADVFPLPPQHVELLVLLTCKRLAEAGGNGTMAAYYIGESDRLWRQVKRDALRYDRFRQEGFTPNDTYDHWRNGGFPDHFWGN